MENESKGKYKGYIYIISNQVNGKQYVGQTTQSIRQRFINHVSSANSKKTRRPDLIIYRAIRKYGRDNFSVEQLEYVECDTKEELRNRLNELEVYHIAEHNTLTPNGYNMTIGGQAIAEQHKVGVFEVDGDGNVIKYFNSYGEAEREYSLRHGTINNGLTSSSHYSCGHYWYRADECDFEIGDNIGKQHHTSSTPKEVYQFDLNGNLLKRYNAICDASKETGICKACITSAAKVNGGNRQAGGYLWSFTENPPDYDPNINYNGLSHSKAIVQLTKDGEFVQEHSSITAASKVINKTIAAVQLCVSGKNKTCGGYKWVYAKDYYNKEVEKDG